MKHPHSASGLLLACAALILAPGCPPPNSGPPPTAAFQADVVSGNAPLTVQFTDASTPGGSPVLTWAWDFGDGRRAFVPSPRHTYVCPGAYEVALTVVTAAGRDTATLAVVVGPGAVAWPACDGEGEGEGAPEGEGEGEGTPEGEGEGGGDPGLTLTRTFPDGATYTPGQPVVVRLRLEYDGVGAVTALALRETQPLGWTFGGFRSGTTSQPPIAPAPGSAGTLEFAWITVPAFPVTLEYALQAPASATGAQNFTAVAIYRKGAGELQSNPAPGVAQPAKSAARLGVLLDQIAAWNVSGDGDFGPLLDAIQTYGQTAPPR